MQVKQLCIHYGSFSMFFFLLSSIIAVLRNNIHYMSCKFREKIKNQCYQTSLAVHISFDNIILLFSRFDLAVKLFFGFRCRYNIYTVAVILSYNKLLILVGKANLYYACKRHCFTYRPSAIRSIDY